MGDKAYETIAQSLETQYAPLDPALVRALLSEYNHEDATELKALHDTLESLRAQAVADDASAFDPSGTSGGDGMNRSSPEKSTSEGWDNSTEGGLTTSSDTDVTNLSTTLNSTTIGDSKQSTTSGGSPSRADISGLAEKEQSLLELFPSQTQHTVAYILQKCDGSFDRAVDVLLNHVYFDESQDGEQKVSLKSVDAFEGNASPHHRKRKGKKKFSNLRPDDDWSSIEGSSRPDTPTNHWQTATDDVGFLASRTNMSAKTIRLMYNKHNASVSATIMAIVEESQSPGTPATSDDPLEEINIATLASEFTTIPLSTVAALIRITAPSTAHAHELAKALIAPPARNTQATSLGSQRLVPQYAPLRLDEASEVKGHSSSTAASTSSTPLSANALAGLRSNAFNSASQYHRKAGSDRLFGGAAAYYGQLGRDYHARLRDASSAEADALVSEQSSSSMVDLHGVSVADAVRIAETRAQRWWEEVRWKEARSNNERVGNGLIIVTGRGVHSKDGRGRLGPAVTKALMKEGWKVEVRTGEVVVLGKAKS